jgi:hypothetical protein
MSNGSNLMGLQGPDRPHLVRGSGGLSGEVADLRGDVARVLNPMPALTVDEFTDVAVADIDAIKTAIASVAAATTYSGSDLNGAVGEAEMVPPRNVTITTAGSTPADAPATAVVTGKVRDHNGNLIDQTDTITISQTAATAAGDVAFSTVTSVAFAAGDGVDATLAVGFGAVIGLSKPLRARAGAAAVLMETEAGTVLAADAVTGTFLAASAAAPNGTYEPATPPDDSNDYAVWYEYTPSAA